MQVFCFPFEDLFFSRLGYFLIAGLVEMQRACDLSSSLGSWNSVILNSYEKGIFPFPSPLPSPSYLWSLRPRSP